MDFLDPYNFILSLSFVVSLSIYYNLSPADYYLKYFPPFLGTTILIEVLGAYLGKTGTSNVYLYNFFTTFEFCFYLWLISLIIVNKSMKRTIRITMFAYLLIALTNIFFIQKLQAFHTVTYALGCLILVVFCIYYFFELFKRPQSIKLASTPAFWICSGLLFFYCCSFPLYALINYWEDISRLIQKNFGEIFMILNVFLYSLFTLAFLCIRARKYTLSQS